LKSVLSENLNRSIKIKREEEGALRPFFICQFASNDGPSWTSENKTAVSDTTTLVVEWFRSPWHLAGDWVAASTLVEEPRNWQWR